MEDGIKRSNGVESETVNMNITPLEGTRIGSVFNLTDDDHAMLDSDFGQMCISCAILPDGDYSLIRWNLARRERRSLGGKLIPEYIGHSEYDTRLREYTEKQLHPSDAAEFCSVLSSSHLIDIFKDGQTTLTYEYRTREVGSDGVLRQAWINLSVLTVKNSITDDIYLYLLFRKTGSDSLRKAVSYESTDPDPLTGLLSRRAFAEQTERLLNMSANGVIHAFLLIGIDGLVYDGVSLGGRVVDNIITEIGQSISSILRHGDIIGRVGTTEYMVCLKDIPFGAVAERRAAQIVSLVRRTLDDAIHISGSIGIAYYPKNGKCFDDIVSNAETAMLAAQNKGANCYCVSGDITDAGIDSGHESSLGDKHSDAAQLAPSVFIVTAPGGADATTVSLLLGDRYCVVGSCEIDSNDGLNTISTGLSAIILSVYAGSGNGNEKSTDECNYSFIGKLKENPMFQYVPVIVVATGGDVDEKAEIDAYEAGAAFFMTVPDEKLLMQLRLKNALDKGERDRLRAQNDYLMMRQSEASRYRTIIRSTSTVVIEYDPVSHVFDYDSAISEYLAGEYDSRALWEILSDDAIASVSDVHSMRQHVEALAADDKREVDSMRVMLKTKSGDVRWFGMNIIKLFDEYQLRTKLYITYNDIHEKLLDEKRLLMLSENDALTGIYNRATFLLRAGKIIEANDPGTYVMACVDINNFKAVNSLYGHETGNDLLKSIALGIADVTDGNGVCGRSSADIFLALLPNTAESVSRLSEAIDEAVSGSGLPIDISYCAGYYVVSDKSLSAETMLDCATMAHSSIKGNYNTRTAFYDTALHDEHARTEEIVMSMNSALRLGQFIPYYQPIYDYRTGKLDTAETLVRWQHPRNGLMLPREFVPLFEKNGFIIHLDQYIWECAFDFMRRRLDRNATVIPLSLNLSRINFYNSELTCFIRSLFMKYRLPTDLVRFEITESAYVQSRTQLISVINELRGDGIHFELDDFGSGYSSLQTLTEVPFDTLKIDMGLINEASEKRQKESVLAHIIDLALSLELDIVAEGVETLEQAEMLASLGCTRLQGFYYSAPVPEKKFVSMLSANQSM